MNLKKEQTMYAVLLIVGIVVLIVGTGLVKLTGFDDLIGAIGGLSGAWIAISSIKLYQIKKKPKRCLCYSKNRSDGSLKIRSI